MFADEPGADASDATIRAYYADDGNQLKLQIASFALTVGAVFFVWFVGTLSGRLRRAEGEGSWLSRIVLVSGAAFTVVMLVGFALG